MSLIIFRHCQNRNHGDGTVKAFLSACSFIHSCKVGIQVARISTTARNLLTCRRYFTKSFRIVCDVGHDNQNVHAQIECQIFSCCKSHTRSCDTLYCRVVGQVHEKHRSVDGAGLSEVGCEELGFLVGDTDSRKYYGEVSFASSNLSLTGNLSSKVCVRKT